MTDADKIRWNICLECVSEDVGKCGRQRNQYLSYKCSQIRRMRDEGKFWQNPYRIEVDWGKTTICNTCNSRLEHLIIGKG